MYKFVKGFKNKNAAADTSIASSSRVDQGVSSGDDTANTLSRSSAALATSPVERTREDADENSRPLSSSSFSIDESTGETIASRRRRPDAVANRTRSSETIRPTATTMSTLDSVSDFNTTATSGKSSREQQRSQSSRPSIDTASTGSRPSSIVKIKPSSSMHASKPRPDTERALIRSRTLSNQKNNNGTSAVPIDTDYSGTNSANRTQRSVSSASTTATVTPAAAQRATFRGQQQQQQTKPKPSAAAAAASSSSASSSPSTSPTSLSTSGSFFLYPPSTSTVKDRSRKRDGRTNRAADTQPISGDSLNSKTVLRELENLLAIYDDDDNRDEQTNRRLNTKHDDDNSSSSAHPRNADTSLSSLKTPTGLNTTFDRIELEANFKLNDANSVATLSRFLKRLAAAETNPGAEPQPQEQPQLPTSNESSVSTVINNLNKRASEDRPKRQLDHLNINESVVDNDRRSHSQTSAETLKRETNDADPTKRSSRLDQRLIKYIQVTARTLKPLPFRRYSSAHVRVEQTRRLTPGRPVPTSTTTTTTTTLKQRPEMVVNNNSSSGKLTNSRTNATSTTTTTTTTSSTGTSTPMPHPASMLAASTAVTHQAPKKRVGNPDSEASVYKRYQMSTPRGHAVHVVEETLTTSFMAKHRAASHAAEPRFSGHQLQPGRAASSLSPHPALAPATGLDTFAAVIGQQPTPQQAHRPPAQHPVLAPPQPLPPHQHVQRHFHQQQFAAVQHAGHVNINESRYFAQSIGQGVTASTQASTTSVRVMRGTPFGPAIVHSRPPPLPQQQANYSGERVVEIYSEPNRKRVRSPSNAGSAATARSSSQRMKLLAACDLNGLLNLAEKHSFRIRQTRPVFYNQRGGDEAPRARSISVNYLYSKRQSDLRRLQEAFMAVAAGEEDGAASLHSGFTTEDIDDIYMPRRLEQFERKLKASRDQGDNSEQEETKLRRKHLQAVQATRRSAQAPRTSVELVNAEAGGSVEHQSRQRANVKRTKHFDVNKASHGKIIITLPPPTIQHHSPSPAAASGKPSSYLEEAKRKLDEMRNSKAYYSNLNNKMKSSLSNLIRASQDLARASENRQRVQIGELAAFEQAGLKAFAQPQYQVSHLDTISQGVANSLARAGLQPAGEDDIDSVYMPWMMENYGRKLAIEALKRRGNMIESIEAKQNQTTLRAPRLNVGLPAAGSARQSQAKPTTGSSYVSQYYAQTNDEDASAYARKMVRRNDLWLIDRDIRRYVKKSRQLEESGAQTQTSAGADPLNMVVDTDVSITDSDTSSEDTRPVVPQKIRRPDVSLKDKILKTINKSLLSRELTGIDLNMLKLNDFARKTLRRVEKRALERDLELELIRSFSCSHLAELRREDIKYTNMRIGWRRPPAFTTDDVLDLYMPRALETYKLKLAIDKEKKNGLGDLAALGARSDQRSSAEMLSTRTPTTGDGLSNDRSPVRGGQRQQAAGFYEVDENEQDDGFGRNRLIVSPPPTIHIKSSSIASPLSPPSQQQTTFRNPNNLFREIIQEKLKEVDQSMAREISVTTTATPASSTNGGVKRGGGRFVVGKGQPRSPIGEVDDEEAVSTDADQDESMDMSSSQSSRSSATEDDDLNMNEDELRNFDIGNAAATADVPRMMTISQAPPTVSTHHGGGDATMQVIYQSPNNAKSKLESSINKSLTLLKNPCEIISDFYISNMNYAMRYSVEYVQQVAKELRRKREIEEEPESVRPAAAYRLYRSLSVDRLYAVRREHIRYANGADDYFGARNISFTTDDIQDIYMPSAIDNYKRKIAVELERRRRFVECSAAANSSCEQLLEQHERLFSPSRQIDSADASPTRQNLMPIDPVVLDEFDRFIINKARISVVDSADFDRARSEQPPLVQNAAAQVAAAEARLGRYDSAELPVQMQASSETCPDARLAYVEVRQPPFVFKKRFSGDVQQRDDDLHSEVKVMEISQQPESASLVREPSLGVHKAAAVARAPEVLTGPTPPAQTARISFEAASMNVDNFVEVTKVEAAEMLQVIQRSPSSLSNAADDSSVVSSSSVQSDSWNNLNLHAFSPNQATYSAAESASQSVVPAVRLNRISQEPEPLVLEEADLEQETIQMATNIQLAAVDAAVVPLPGKVVIREPVVNLESAQARLHTPDLSMPVLTAHPPVFVYQSDESALPSPPTSDQLLPPDRMDADDEEDDDIRLEQVDSVRYETPALLVSRPLVDQVQPFYLAKQRPLEPLESDQVAAQLPATEPAVVFEAHLQASELPLTPGFSIRTRTVQKLNAPDQRELSHLHEVTILAETPRDARRDPEYTVETRTHVNMTVTYPYETVVPAESEHHLEPAARVNLSSEEAAALSVATSHQNEIIQNLHDLSEDSSSMLTTLSPLKVSESLSVRHEPAQYISVPVQVPLERDEEFDSEPSTLTVDDLERSVQRANLSINKLPLARSSVQAPVGFYNAPVVRENEHIFQQPQHFEPTELSAEQIEQARESTQKAPSLAYQQKLVHVTVPLNVKKAFEGETEPARYEEMTQSLEISDAGQDLSAQVLASTRSEPPLDGQLYKAELSSTDALSMAAVEDVHLREAEPLSVDEELEPERLKETKQTAEANESAEWTQRNVYNFAKVGLEAPAEGYAHPFIANTSFDQAETSVRNEQEDELVHTLQIQARSLVAAVLNLARQDSALEAPQLQADELDVSQESRTTATERSQEYYLNLKASTFEVATLNMPSHQQVPVFDLDTTNEIEMKSEETPLRSSGLDMTTTEARPAELLKPVARKPQVISKAFLNDAFVKEEIALESRQAVVPPSQTVTPTEEEADPDMQERALSKSSAPVRLGMAETRELEMSSASLFEPVAPADDEAEEQLEARKHLSELESKESVLVQPRIVPFKMAEKSEDTVPADRADECEMDAAEATSVLGVREAELAREQAVRREPVPVICAPVLRLEDEMLTETAGQMEVSMIDVQEPVTVVEAAKSLARPELSVHQVQSLNSAAQQSDHALTESCHEMTASQIGLPADALPTESAQVLVQERAPSSRADSIAKPLKLNSYVVRSSDEEVQAEDASLMSDQEEPQVEEPAVAKQHVLDVQSPVEVNKRGRIEKLALGEPCDSSVHFEPQMTEFETSYMDRVQPATFTCVEADKTATAELVRKSDLRSQVVLNQPVLNSLDLEQAEGLDTSLGSEVDSDVERAREARQSADLSTGRVSQTRALNAPVYATDNYDDDDEDELCEHANVRLTGASGEQLRQQAQLSVLEDECNLKVGIRSSSSRDSLNMAREASLAESDHEMTATNAAAAYMRKYESAYENVNVSLNSFAHGSRDVRQRTHERYCLAREIIELSKSVDVCQEMPQDATTTRVAVNLIDDEDETTTTTTKLVVNDEPLVQSRAHQREIELERCSGVLPELDAPATPVERREPDELARAIRPAATPVVLNKSRTNVNEDELELDAGAGQLRYFAEANRTERVRVATAEAELATADRVEPAPLVLFSPVQLVVSDGQPQQIRPDETIASIRSLADQPSVSQEAGLAIEAAARVDQSLALNAARQVELDGYVNRERVNFLILENNKTTAQVLETEPEAELDAVQVKMPPTDEEEFAEQMNVVEQTRLQVGHQIDLFDSEQNNLPDKKLLIWLNYPKMTVEQGGSDSDEHEEAKKLDEKLDYLYERIEKDGKLDADEISLEPRIEQVVRIFASSQSQLSGDFENQLASEAFFVQDVIHEHLATSCHELDDDDAEEEDDELRDPTRLSVVSPPPEFVQAGEETLSTSLCQQLADDDEPQPQRLSATDEDASPKKYVSTKEIVLLNAPVQRRLAATAAEQAEPLVEENKLSFTLKESRCGEPEEETDGSSTNRVQVVYELNLHPNGTTISCDVSKMSELDEDQLSFIQIDYVQAEARGGHHHHHRRLGYESDEPVSSSHRIKSTSTPILNSPVNGNDDDDDYERIASPLRFQTQIPIFAESRVRPAVSVDSVCNEILDDMIDQVMFNIISQRDTTSAAGVELDDINSQFVEDTWELVSRELSNTPSMMRVLPIKSELVSPTKYSYDDRYEQQKSILSKRSIEWDYTGLLVGDEAAAKSQPYFYKQDEKMDEKELIKKSLLQTITKQDLFLVSEEMAREEASSSPATGDDTLSLSCSLGDDYVVTSKNNNNNNNNNDEESRPPTDAAFVLIKSASSSSASDKPHNRSAKIMIKRKKRSASAKPTTASTYVQNTDESNSSFGEDLPPLHVDAHQAHYVTEPGSPFAAACKFETSFRVDGRASVEIPIRVERSPRSGKTTATGRTTSTLVCNESVSEMESTSSTSDKIHFVESIEIITHHHHRSQTHIEQTECTTKEQINECLSDASNLSDCSFELVGSHDHLLASPPPPPPAQVHIHKVDRNCLRVKEQKSKCKSDAARSPRQRSEPRFKVDFRQEELVDLRDDFESVYRNAEKTLTDLDNLGAARQPSRAKHFKHKEFAKKFVEQVIEMSSRRLSDLEDSGEERPATREPSSSHQQASSLNRLTSRSTHEILESLNHVQVSNLGKHLANSILIDASTDINMSLNDLEYHMSRPSLYANDDDSSSDEQRGPNSRVTPHLTSSVLSSSKIIHTSQDQLNQFSPPPHRLTSSATVLPIRIIEPAARDESTKSSKVRISRRRPVYRVGTGHN